MKTIALFVSVLGLSTLSSSAAIIAMNLEGQGGVGLLSTNEHPTVPATFHTGGEVGGGITFDTVTKVLTINVAWGASNGFSNLTANATAGHIHGATASGGVASFTQTTGVLFNFGTSPSWNPSSTAGGVLNYNTPALNPTQEAQLLEGRFYINIHTAANPGGEIRGNIVIPEASTAMFGLLGGAALLIRKRR